MSDNPLDAAMNCQCGHGDLALIRADHGFTVVCMTCYASGPKADTPEEAVKGWNKEAGQC